jgi:hypothetical protein
LAFLDKSFSTVSPGQTLVQDWHLSAIAHRLEQVRKGEVRRLIINLPPRSLKSITASVAFPAFVLGHDPTRRLICVSYSSELAAKHASDFRAIITSPWYRERHRKRSKWLRANGALAHAAKFSIFADALLSLRCLSDDPLQRLAFMARIVGFHLRMQEYSEGADKPMLPIVRGDDCDALYFLLVVFYESSMIFKSRDILPSVESGSINQQSDLPMLTD